MKNLNYQGGKVRSSIHKYVKFVASETKEKKKFYSDIDLNKNSLLYNGGWYRQLWMKQ